MNWLKKALREVLGLGGQGWSPVPAVAAVAVVVLLALGGIIAYAVQYSPATAAASVASSAVLIGLAALLAGGLLGFVFGIPRSLQEIRADANQPAYQGNTNLEQISDWLTKILVGVGLTQIRELPTQVHRLITYLSPGLGGQASSQGFALAVLVYFSVSGFVIGYLATRLLLGQAFRLADQAASLEERISRVEQAISDSSVQTPIEGGSR